MKLFNHNYLTGGFTANTSLSMYCRDNGLLLHIHRAMHAVILWNIKTILFIKIL